jgi:hypothetical protein
LAAQPPGKDRPDRLIRGGGARPGRPAIAGVAGHNKWRRIFLVVIGRFGLMVASRVVHRQITFQ